MLICTANTGDALSNDRIFLLGLLFELRKRHFLIVFLLCFQLVDHGHLLINLDQEIFDMTVDIVDIPRNFGLNVLRSVCVTQSILGLVKMLTGWTDADDHDCSAIATKGEFQQTGEFRISVRHMISLARVAKRIDAASQGKQRLVDVGSFKEALPSILCSACTLASSKIDNAESRHCVRLVDIGVAVLLGDIDLEDGV